MAIPSLLLVLGMLLWGVTAAAHLLQCVDAARVGARAAARGEPPEATRTAALSAAPPSARVTLAREGDLVRVRIVVRTAGPHALSVPISSEAVARSEAAGEPT